MTNDIRVCGGNFPDWSLERRKEFLAWVKGELKRDEAKRLKPDGQDPQGLDGEATKARSRSDGPNTGSIGDGDE